jgi:hypothetical protein
MANAMGFDDTCVQSVAVARISSGSIGMAPFYATTACLTGPQVMKSDAGGPSIPFSVPELAKDGESNTSVLDSSSSNPSPNQITLALTGAPDGPQLTVTGTNLGSTVIDKVGFFNSDRTDPVQAAPLATPAQTSGSVTVNVPNQVASYQDVWWVRVHNSGTGMWSARAQARPPQVGDAVLSCDATSSSGNFGSIDVPHGGNDLADLEANVRDGLRPPTTLKPWPGPPPYPGENVCQGVTGVAVTSSDTTSKENTNCVQSVTGLKAKPVYDGYLKSPSGKLLVDTSPACLSLGRPSRGPHNENSDVLSCFLKNDTLKLSDTVHYNGPDGLFTQDIWESPRFVLVPKLENDPNGTKWMPITGVVPGFITDQPTGASRQYPLVTGATDNGLVVQHPDKLRAIRVFFFSMNALPPPPDGLPLQDYLGTGKKVISLVN